MSALKRLHEIDTKTKCIVFGYVRSNHKFLFKSNQNALFQNIPISISSLCTLYYHLYDYFDEINPRVNLTKDNKTISIMHGNWPNLPNFNFGKQIIASTSKKINKWHLRINSIKYMSIGIMSSPWNVNSNLFQLIFLAGDTRPKYYMYSPKSGNSSF